MKYWTAPFDNCSSPTIEGQRLPSTGSLTTGRQLVICRAVVVSHQLLLAVSRLFHILLQGVLLLCSMQANNWQVTVVNELWDQTELHSVGNCLFLFISQFYFSQSSYLIIAILSFFLSFFFSILMKLGPSERSRRTRAKIPATKYRIAQSCQTIRTASRSAQTGSSGNSGRSATESFTASLLSMLFLEGSWQRINQTSSSKASQ